MHERSTNAPYASPAAETGGAAALRHARGPRPRACAAAARSILAIDGRSRPHFHNFPYVYKNGETIYIYIFVLFIQPIHPWYIVFIKKNIAGAFLVHTLKAVYNIIGLSGAVIIIIVLGSGGWLEQPF